MPIPTLRPRRLESWQEHRPKSRRPKKALFKKLLKIILIFAAVLLIAGFIYTLIISRNLPNPNQLINRQVAQSTKIYDRTGEHVLYEISGDERRTLVQLKDIPANVKNATVAIEDKNFYKHGGFSLWSMFRTAVTDVLFHRSAGGSTLTQQFIKNAVLTNEKTFTRKIKELILAYRLEQKFSKDDILQMYLNEIPYGSNAYGVEAASQKYFGKGVKDVDLAEAAILAAIPQAPSRYSPYGPNKDLLLGRKNYILDVMAEQGYISATERDNAKQEVLKFKEPDNNMIAPHFVMYIKAILAEKYGEQMIEQEGLKIYTTLDLYKQQIAEQVIKDRTKDYPKTYNANNAALVAIDPKTGQILAMVGSRDYFDDTIDGQVNVSTSPRQPGSSMKPVVYSALFERGYTPDSILYDVVTNFSTDPKQPYEPHDYDLKQRGPVTIRQALAGSLNIPAVKAIYLADINNVLDLADNLGYTTLYPRNRFGLSLVLGGGEVKLLEHANAYSAFARDGVMSPTVGILKVEDKNGHVLEEYQPSTKKVLSSQVAREINSILTDNGARAYIFGAKNYLTLNDRPVGAKTGTTNDYHDAWTIGFTPSLVAGVWVGNNDNKAMKGKADGSVVAAPIWHDFMDKVLTGTPVETFKAPDDYKTGKPILDGQLPTETISVDVSTGLPATTSTPPELIGQKTATVFHDTLYYIDKNDPLGPAPANPGQDPQFNLWESAVQKWANSSSSANLILPSATSTGVIDNNPALGNFGNPADQPIIKISAPLANQTVTAPNLEVQIKVSAARGVSRAEYYLNGNLWETRWGAPTIFGKSISFLNNGYQSLSVKVCDDAENCATQKVDFNLLVSNNPTSGLKNSVKIIAPVGGAVSAANFPLPIALAVAQPTRTANLDIMVRDGRGNLITLNTLNNLSGPNPTSAWTNPPPAGAYTLYAELHDWNGDVMKSNEINLTVN